MNDVLHRKLDRDVRLFASITLLLGVLIATRVEGPEASATRSSFSAS